MQDLKNMSIDEKIAQMLMVDLDKKEPEDKLLKIIKADKISGIVLYSKCYEDYEVMLELINKIKTANQENKTPLFISVDQEGGRVNRIPEPIHNLKSAYRFANLKDIEVLKRTGHIIGKILRESGINLNYAPVLDIKRFPDDHPIGNRCYGENKEDSAKYGIQVMNAISNEQVIPVVKHFPGHGATTKDSHRFLPRITAPVEELEKEDMYPFEEAIKNGCEAVMVGHLIVENIDRTEPASLSKKLISKYLVEKNNYKGLIVTDDLKMWGIKLKYRPEVAVYKAIQAGNDLILIGANTKKVRGIIRYISRKIKNGNLSIERIEYSVEKILRIKEKYNINDEIVRGTDIENVNKEIDELNKLLEK